MTWVRIEEEFAEHPKVVGLSDRAFRSLVRGLCYCNRLLTDGLIPKSLARQWGKAAELVAAGVWTEEPDGYRIHDFHDYQPTRAAVTERREQVKQIRSKAGSKGAAKRWQTGSQTDNPDPVPVSVPKDKIKSVTPTDVGLSRRDVVFEALCEIEGIDWHTANEREHGRIRKARHLAEQSKATPDEIRQAAERWPDVMGDATRTAIGVMGRFQQLLNSPARSNGRPTRDRAQEIFDKARGAQ